jgi:carbonic anhydrase
MLMCLIFIIYLAKYSQNQTLDYSESNWDTICKIGLHQSPIDFNRSINYVVRDDYIKIISQHYNALENISLRVREEESFGFDIADHGYVMLYKNGVMYKYKLIDVHLHTKSEHRIDGKTYDLEVHLYHLKDRDHLLTQKTRDPHDEPNDILVVGMLFDASLDIADPILEKMNLKDLTPVNIHLHDLYTVKEGFYHYKGSTTTPPCQENINWMVLDTIRPMSKEQLKLLTNLVSQFYPNGNGRSVKPLNGRTVYRVFDSSLPDGWGDVLFSELLGIKQFNLGEYL